jgi:hypothetical protein
MIATHATLPIMAGKTSSAESFISHPESFTYRSDIGDGQAGTAENLRPGGPFTEVASRFTELHLYNSAFLVVTSKMLGLGFRSVVIRAADAGIAKVPLRTHSHSGWHWRPATRSQARPAAPLIFGGAGTLPGHEADAKLPRVAGKEGVGWTHVPAVPAVPPPPAITAGGSRGPARGCRDKLDNEAHHANHPLQVQAWRFSGKALPVARTRVNGASVYN